MHAKHVFLKDVVWDKLADNRWQLYIAAAATFVYFAMSHMRM